MKWPCDDRFNWIFWGLLCFIACMTCDSLVNRCIFTNGYITTKTPNCVPRTSVSMWIFGSAWTELSDTIITEVVQQIRYDVIVMTYHFPAVIFFRFFSPSRGKCPTSGCVISEYIRAPKSPPLKLCLNNSRCLNRVTFMRHPWQACLLNIITIYQDYIFNLGLKALTGSFANAQTLF